MSESIFFFDTETGGLDPKRHDILQASWIIEKNGAVIVERVFDVKPDPCSDICMAALEVNNFSIERMMAGKERVMVLEILRQDVAAAVGGGKALYPCGHNVRFDVDFLHALAQKGSETWWLNFSPQTQYIMLKKQLCTLSMCHILDYRGLLSLQDYKLVSICKHLGIENINAHDALSDVRATRELFHRLEKML
jgi:DNA polymerase-3 subunit epsilon